VKCSAVKGVNRGVPWRVFTSGEVKVMLKLVRNTCGVTILETRHSTFFPLCCFYYVHCC